VVLLLAVARAVLIYLAVVLVVLGSARALTALGMPTWCAFLVVGLTALLLGLLFYLRWWYLCGRVAPTVFGRVPERATGMLDLVQTLEEAQRQQMEPFFDKTRETILASIDEATEQHLRSLVEQLRQTLLQTAEQLQKRQLDPLLDQTQKFLLGIADELRDKYTAPLAEQVRKVLLDTADEMRRKHGQPLQDVINLNLTLAAALLCVAVILAAVGTAQALAAFGMPTWCALLVVGLAALLLGLLYSRWRKLGSDATGSHSGRERQLR
jgi:hypothetical protein